MPVAKSPMPQWLYFLLLFVLTACTDKVTENQQWTELPRLPASGKREISVALNRLTIKTSDILRVRILAISDINDSVIFPNEDHDFSDFSLIALNEIPQRINTEKQLISGRIYSLEPDKAGRILLPGMPIFINNPTNSFDLVTQTIAIQVDSVLQKGKENLLLEDIHGEVIKDIDDSNITASILTILAMIATFALIFLISLYLVFKHYQRKTRASQSTIFINAENYLFFLSRCRESNEYQKNIPAIQSQFYRLLQNQFGLKQRISNSETLLQQLEKFGMPKKQLNKLATCLEQLDKLRFANADITRENFLELLIGIENFIREISA